MIYENEKVVEEIKKFISEKKKEKNIVNVILQDNIFELLNKDCVLLYYPLDDDIKGIHLEKIVAGEPRQFVYINTEKKVEEQTWTAAHELGHVWKVEKYVYKNIPDCDVELEDIVNRFASELLMPEKEFENEFQYAKGRINKTDVLTRAEFIRLVAYLMNTFCVPYKAAIRRMVELGKVSRDNEERFINSFADNLEYFHKVIQENYYTKLDLTKRSCSMEDISSDIDLLENNNVVKEKVIERYRKAFNIEKEDVSSETFEFGGGDGQ